MSEHSLLLIYIVVAIITTNLPVVGVYFSLCNTLVHEFSHALLASIFTRRLGHTITLNHNASGMAITSINSWVSRVAVSYAGYTGSSLMAVVLFYLLHKSDYQLVIEIFTALTVVTAILWVRNLYGFMWSVSVIFTLGSMLFHHLTLFMMHASMFISSVILVQSVFAASHILKLSVVKREEAGDAASLEEATFIPAPIWGLLFCSQSIYAVWIIFRYLY
ncbi:M50 family metallopeptidase [Heyndrickxia acidicola]|uniref:M50 family metallopeptidase n=1 Tax=Heyndrickxia acidicola TaxID=209389 RepID=A0ABU6MLE7_9BACI|nr:M50 family metallopeptidase [Heyndrickxia acidicola]MED1205510.1 M50 family metallopeptidase [Heyndrickxia acidicola]